MELFLLSWLLFHHKAKKAVVLLFLIPSLSSTYLLPVMSMEFYKCSQTRAIFREFVYFKKFLLSFSTLPPLLMQLICAGALTRVPGLAREQRHKLKERYCACGIIFTISVLLLQWLCIIFLRQSKRYLWKLLILWGNLQFFWEGRYSLNLYFLALDFSNIWWGKNYCNSYYAELGLILALLSLLYFKINWKVALRKRNWNIMNMYM